MSFTIDPATLAAMAQEARQCFLDEDAPEYLQIFKDGLQNCHNSPDFTDLLRAAHSLKGGAGLADLPHLRTLSHRLEDLLQALNQGQLRNLEEGWMLFEWAVGEVEMMLTQAQTTQDVPVDAYLLEALEAFSPIESPESSAEVSVSPSPGGNASILQTALTEDLEACFVRLEELSLHMPVEVLRDGLETFLDECLLLGETLELPWLVEAIAPLETILEEEEAIESLAVTRELVSYLRSQRDHYLEASTIEESVPEVIEPQPQQEQAALSHLRIPLQRLEGMTKHIEELIVVKERISLQQKQLQEALKRLSQLNRQFEPIREQVQTVYDQLAIAPSPSSDSPLPQGLNQPYTAIETTAEFDALELDRFTPLHSSLQAFQELMLRVQETRADLDFINRELSENVEQTQSNLNKLYEDVTESRLVPFRNLAQRFLPQIQALNLRSDKSAELIIEGDDILADQVLLAQLQTPLTHLLNNAFDHGIEPPSERIAAQKLETAQIILQAKMENNQLVIELRDNGRGIDLHRVYQKALERELCSPEIAFEELSQEDIIKWIFQPEFSTADKVSDLSGRGVGLDIVRTQIQRLRGLLQVKTHPGQGTSFTLKFTLSLSLQSLFLVQWQNRLLAFPTITILESLPYREIQWVGNDFSKVNWRGQEIPILPLSELLPYGNAIQESIPPLVGLVLNTGFGSLMVTVDTLVCEQELIVKPFDDTVMIPPYLGGCTILATGEVVPVILPQAFEKLSSQLPIPTTPDVISSSAQIPTIVVVEDSVATRRLLERILTEIGCEVILYRDGQEAWQNLPQHQGQIDLIISDIEMPRLNGFELLEKLRTDIWWAKVPVVMATSRTGERHRQRAMELGATAYLGKPIQAPQLLATLEPLLSGIVREN